MLQARLILTATSPAMLLAKLMATIRLPKPAGMLTLKLGLMGGTADIIPAMKKAITPATMTAIMHID